MHLSVGVFPAYYLVPSWLDMFLEGGAVTHDHFGANDFNIGVLKGRNVRDIVVVVRDPRAAARSQVHHLARGNDGPLRRQEGRIEEECVEKFVPWLQAWIDLAKCADLPFRIHWLRYQEISQNPAETVRKVVTILQEHYPAMSRYAKAVGIEEVRAHFVTGDDQAWKSEVSKRTRDRLWNACSADIKNLLGLEW